MLPFWSKGYCYLQHQSVHLSKSCPGQYSETIQDSCFILSEQINRTWNLYTVRLFWHFEIQPWKYDLYLECFVLGITRKLHGSCFILLGYIVRPWDLCTVGLFWPFDLYIMTVTLKILVTFTIKTLKCILYILICQE